MALTVGNRIGPYEITAFIGEGGMGQVYQATDMNLGRRVAIKILPDAFASDPERLARFEREAKTLAALNHPNIAQIYGFEKADGVRALVMELVEGPTLADRIAHGPILVEDALPIARQITEALEAAHEQGIIHRDLKPANIKLRPDGTVKVLDFGLAKAFEAEPAAAAALSVAPTITSPAATRLGTILGTAAYMSPEQARGKAVDKRTDIWAFGCMLYEMLTGKRAFAGEEVTDVLARVIERQPDLAALPSRTPPAIRRLVERCLEKDPKHRLRDIGEARIEIDGLGREAPDQSVVAAPLLVRPSWRQYGWAAAGVLVGDTLIGIALGRLPQLTQPGPTETIRAPLLRTTIDLPPDAPLALGSELPTVGYNSPLIAISPDGRWLAYVAQTAAGRLLHVRDMSTGDVRPLPGTEGIRHPFFSPDGQWIGFLTADQVKKAPRQGGAVISLCEASNPVFGICPWR